MNEEIQALIDAAQPLVTNMTLGRDDYSAATVAAAIRTKKGNVYTGICIDVSCGMGFCAEHAAAAEMIKAGETQIAAMVAVSDDSILAPCGRCREFLVQIDPRNVDTEVILQGNRTVLLSKLLPEH